MKKIVLALFGLAVLAIGWYLASPLFIDQVVDEPFPTAADIAAMTEAEREVAMEAAFTKAAAMPDQFMEEPMPSSPTVIATGEFSDVDALHQGSGTATIYRLADGEYTVRLDPFSVSNGPDLYVYLARAAKPEDGKDVAVDFVSLGKLKGNIGAQNYPIPADVDPATFGSVVVYCQLFGVLFSPASLEFTGEG